MSLSLRAASPRPWHVPPTSLPDLHHHLFFRTSCASGLRTGFPSGGGTSSFKVTVHKKRRALAPKSHFHRAACQSQKQQHLLITGPGLQAPPSTHPTPAPVPAPVPSVDKK